MNCSNYFSSVTGRAALQRFHFPIMDEFFAVHVLQFFSFDGVRAPLPAEVRDFIHGPDVRRWIAMAVQTEAHAERFAMAHLVHLVTCEPPPVDPACCSSHCRGRWPAANRPSTPDCGSSCRWTRRADWRTRIFPRRCDNSGNPHPG